MSVKRRRRTAMTPRVHAERRLRHVGDGRVGRQVEGFGLALVAHEQHAAVDLPHRPLDLRVAGMADEDHRPAAGGILAPLDVDLGDERAGRVQHPQGARAGIGLDRARHAVRTEDRHRLRRHFVQVFDEHGALGAQAVDHRLVVDDFVAHVHGRTMPFERALDDLDGSDDARAKPARLG